MQMLTYELNRLHFPSSNFFCSLLTFKIAAISKQYTASRPQNASICGVLKIYTHMDIVSIIYRFKTCSKKKTKEDRKSWISGVNINQFALHENI